MRAGLAWGAGLAALAGAVLLALAVGLISLLAASGASRALLVDGSTG